MLAATKERPMKSTRFLPAVIAFTLAFFLAASGAMAKSGLDIVEKKCSSCHSLKRLCRGLDLKDKQGWDATLDRMIQKRGAKLSPQERAQVYRYIILQTSKSAPFCK